MRTNGIFRTHWVRLKLKSVSDEIIIKPFGDIHRSSPACDVDRWHKYLEECKEELHRNKKVLFLGTGDYDDMASTSEREILGHRALHESTRDTLEDVYTRHVVRFAKEIQFMKGHFIGIMEGNHYGEYQNGTTTTQRLCEVVRAPYLGACTFIYLELELYGHKTAVRIFAHHGRGSARLTGGSINKVQQMAEIAEADIYMMGDDHKMVGGTSSRLTLVPFKGHLYLKERKMVYLRTGSFLKAYEPDRASYVVDALLNPTTLGAPSIKISLSRGGGSKDKHGPFKVDFKTTI